MKRTKLSVRHRGPLVVEGDFDIYGSDGERIDLRGATKVKLCRCGQSKHPPICDGTHYRTNFEAPTSAGADQEFESD